MVESFFPKKHLSFPHCCCGLCKHKQLFLSVSFQIPMTVIFGEHNTFCLIWLWLVVFSFSWSFCAFSFLRMFVASFHLPYSVPLHAHQTKFSSLPTPHSLCFEANKHLRATLQKLTVFSNDNFCKETSDSIAIYQKYYYLYCLLTKSVELRRKPSNK